MLLLRWSKPGLAAGVILAGADLTAARGQTPYGVPAVAPAAAGDPAPGGCGPADGSKCRAMARGSLMHPRVLPVSPFGPAVTLHFQTHVTNAVAARMALYDYDFLPGTAQLNYRGRDRVRQIAGLLPYNPFPVVVEWRPAAPDMAAARRAAVVAELAAYLGQVPADRVVVGPPPVAPLRGTDTELIYTNMLRLTESAGTTPGTGVRGATSGTPFGGGFGSGFGTGTGGGGLGAPLGR